ncbi:MAG: GMC family oxidoreductase [Candidatus Eremiobacteraeota bacterium]|nr:GMC family oxidoreductase [Candidatus Eremiobacteraeota bacterium]
MMLSQADRATLHALYATFAPAEAPARAAEAMAQAIERLPQQQISELQRFLALLRTPVFCVAIAGKAMRFDALCLPDRERALRTLANHPLAKLRSAYQAVKRLSLFLAYSYSEGERNVLWDSLAYPGPRNDVPEVQEALQVTAPQEVRAHYDVIVIGSGAGGGVAAGICSQAGMNVLVLEAGPPVESVARLQREFDALSNLYLDAGLTSTQDLGVAILAGSCLGGGTSVNWSTSLALSRTVAQQWSDASGGIDFDESLAHHYRSVSERLGIAPTFSHNRNNAVLKRGAEALDWRGFAHPRNAANCGPECGYCGFGCAYGRKNSTPRTYLRDAISMGAHVVTDALVERVHLDAGRPRAVNVRFANGGDVMLRTIAARRIILAAGALRTPGILAASGVRDAHVGAHLHLHPASAVLARFEEPIDPWSGPMQSYLIDEFGDVDKGYGVKLEAVPAHPGLGALAIPWLGNLDHAERMREMRHYCALIALVRDRGEGRITTKGAPKITYALDRYDAGHLRLGIQKLAQVALAAGATRVQTVHNTPLECNSHAEASTFERAVARAPMQANRIGLFSAHQMGTARMHADVRQGVVDASGRVYGYDGLYIADSSVFPLASGVNPMLTIMAIAHRTTSEVVAQG